MSDADIWCEPGRVGDLVARLGDYGWRPRPESALGRLLTTHSISVIHPGWPCDIDVHRDFPGFLADPEGVFDELWERRVAIDIAGIMVDALDREASILVGALHALRNPGRRVRDDAELQYLEAAIRGTFDVEGLQRLREEAELLGAMETARAFLERVGLELGPPLPPGKDKDLDAWRLRTASGASVLVRTLIALRDSRWRSRPRLLLAAIWPSAASLRIDHPEIVAGRASALGTRVVRLSRGVRSVPAALRASSRVRRGHQVERDREI